MRLKGIFIPLLLLLLTNCRDKKSTDDLKADPIADSLSTHQYGRPQNSGFHRRGGAKWRAVFARRI